MSRVRLFHFLALFGILQANSKLKIWLPNKKQMNVTFPDWALAKYPELATLHIGAYETVSIFIVNVLPFTSPEQKDKLLSYLLFNPTAQAGITGLIVLAVVGIATAGVVIWVLGMARKFKQLTKDDQKFVLLELRPLHTQEQKILSTTELFTVLHSTLGQQSVPYSLEIVSSKREGIRYVLRIPESDNKLVQQVLKSHVPHLKIIQAKDYLEGISAESVSIHEFGLTTEFPHPLSTPEVLDVQDPISYLASSLGGLKNGEMVVLQYVIQPLTPKEQKVQADLLSRIVNDEPVFQQIQATRKRSLGSTALIWALRIVFFIPFPWLVIAYYLVKPLIKKRAVVYTQGQQELLSSVKFKLEQPLYTVAIRAIIRGASEKTQQEKLLGLQAAFSSFDNSFQALKPVSQTILHNLSFFQKLQLLSTQKRSFITSYRNTLSTVELAALYHFPNYKSGAVEDLVKTHSKDLPVPLSVKNTEFDVIFARSEISESDIPIGLTDEDRSRHVYILGQTGSGKSTIIYHMAKDDIQKGRGVAIIDPHGDLAEDLLATVPENRIQDCVYLNPFDVRFPIGINILELTPELKEDELEQEKELVCEGVISVFRRVFSNDEKTNAHRIEYILRNAIYTTFTIPDATIFTVYELLNNPKFQKSVTRNLQDQNLKDFWKNEFEKAGNYQIVKMVSGVTAKIGRFLFSPSAKRMLEQPRSTINFGEILDDHKILICNLSEGKVGEDTSQLLGTTILAKLQQAAMRRALTKASKRPPFYIFVDEFQNFATSSFTKLLSGGRKFGLRMTIAQQTTAQQEDENVTNIILANTGTVICFRTASPIDAQLMADQFQPYLGKSDINNLPRYNFYMRLAAVEPEEPFSGITLPIEADNNVEFIDRITAASRKNYAVKYSKPKDTAVRVQKKYTTKLEDASKIKTSILP